MNHLFKLIEDGKTVGYLRIAQVPDLGMRVEFQRVTDEKTSWYVGDGLVFDTAHPFVTKDKHGKDVFEGDRLTFYHRNIESKYATVEWNNEKLQWWAKTVGGSYLEMWELKEVVLIEEQGNE